jgi:cytochrome P450
MQEVTPVLQDVYDPASQEYCENPAPQCQALYNSGRFVYYEPWGAWCMTQLDDIMQCWKEEYLSSDFYDWEFAPPRPPEADWTNFERCMIGHSLLADHDHHLLIRKIAAPAFSRNVVDEIQRRIEPDIKQLFDDLGKPDVFDYKSEVAQHIPFISITRLIGVPEKYWDAIRPVVRNFTDTWNPTLSDEVRESARQECNIAVDIFKEMLAERRAAPQQDDVLSILLKAEEENEDFDEWDILTLILALIGAGSDTTFTFQQWTVYSLLKHKEQIATAMASHDAFANAFSEVSRWGVISKMGFARYAPRDMEVCGQQVKRGQMILMMPHLYEHDPKYFPEPQKFDVTRTFEPDIRFGYGPRFCIGAALAKRQMYLTVSELMNRFPNAELDSEPERLANETSIAFKNLMVRTNV